VLTPGGRGVACAASWAVCLGHPRHPPQRCGCWWSSPGDGAGWGNRRRCQPAGDRPADQQGWGSQCGICCLLRRAPGL